MTSNELPAPGTETRAVCTYLRWHDTNCAVGDATGICGRYAPCPLHPDWPTATLPAPGEPGEGVRDAQVAAEPSTTPDGSVVSTQDGGEPTNGEAAGTGPLPAADTLARRFYDRMLAMAAERDAARAEAAGLQTDLAAARTFGDTWFNAAHDANQRADTAESEAAGLRERLAAAVDRVPHEFGCSRPQSTCARCALDTALAASPDEVAPGGEQL